jgi:DNA helicase-2/ATP-dependent DNA helicase PcrA
MHAAKGLEWDAVFVVGLVDGVLPIAQSLSRPEAVEEERRLLYVAATRARERLVLSWSLARNPGAKRARPRSRFLTGLAPDSGPTAPPPRRSAKRAKVVLEGEAGELFERLRTWRSAAAQAASVPAYVVFTDATLQAIAETRPASLRELAGLPGVGARKLELYGDAVLTTVSG